MAYHGQERQKHIKVVRFKSPTPRAREMSYPNSIQNASLLGNTRDWTHRRGTDTVIWECIVMQGNYMRKTKVLRGSYTRRISRCGAFRPKRRQGRVMLPGLLDLQQVQDAETKLNRVVKRAKGNKALDERLTRSRPSFTKHTGCSSVTISSRCRRLHRTCVCCQVDLSRPHHERLTRCCARDSTEDKHGKGKSQLHGSSTQQSSQGRIKCSEFVCRSHAGMSSTAHYCHF